VPHQCCPNYFHPENISDLRKQTLNPESELKFADRRLKNISSLERIVKRRANQITGKRFGRRHNTILLNKPR
jgi:hypothetical protein